jgi:hypothetical protein
MIAFLRTAEVRTHLGAVTRLCLANDQPLAPDRRWWPTRDRPEVDHRPQTTLSGNSLLPVGPIWISVSISGQTPQS